jgi:hypothetical protein
VGDWARADPRSWQLWLVYLLERLEKQAVDNTASALSGAQTEGVTGFYNYLPVVARP